MRRLTFTRGFFLNKPTKTFDKVCVPLAWNWLVVPNKLYRLSSLPINHMTYSLINLTDYLSENNLLDIILRPHPPYICPQFIKVYLFGMTKWNAWNYPKMDKSQHHFLFKNKYLHKSTTKRFGLALISCNNHKFVRI